MNNLDTSHEKWFRSLSTVRIETPRKFACFYKVRNVTVWVVENSHFVSSYLFSWIAIARPLGSVCFDHVGVQRITVEAQ